MISTILSLLALAPAGGPQVSVGIQMGPGVEVVYHNDAWYRDREQERRRERGRLEQDRERDRHERELWEHRKPGDRWVDAPWHDRQDEWERERIARDRLERQREQARLDRIRFLEAEAARDREERRLALERRLEDERREEVRERIRAEDPPAPIRGDVRIHDDGPVNPQGVRGIAD